MQNSALPMANQLTKKQRIEIGTLSEEGWTVRRLAKKYSANASTISRTVAKATKYDVYTHLGKNGRPSKCSSLIMSHIKAKNGNNSRMSLRKIAN